MKRILFIMLVLGVVKGASGQSNYGQFQKRVRLGFNLDPSISIMNPQESGASRTGAKAGLGFGLIADFSLNEQGNYAIASGFNVVLGGSKIKYDAGKGLSDYKAQPAEYNFKFTHIQIPLALKLKTNQNDYGMAFWGQFGTYFAFPVSARVDVTTPTQSFDKVNILPDVNRINIGMLIGAGVDYELSESLTGSVGLIYQNGFIDATRNAKWNDGRVNINSFALRLGVYF
ncbi:Outer membrane protein beta-barrel domain-containing protein [Chitinophaga jiangningensis]|uniref:Outer membrane protein beta-barrel domain-containing protein n=1 Tax=Chitinophaga jiangningensis TaxID=1419482 RepID=A0A1M6X441_9BACT|nr:porin family protein [Chitinophaga jiangningensis]SHL00684.1 Outer membrane protein beta-barrel domain-containing protein [Chitinophaga jiangningensis]